MPSALPYFVRRRGVELVGVNGSSRFDALTFQVLEVVPKIRPASSAASHWIGVFSLALTMPEVALPSPTLPSSLGGLKVRYRSDTLPSSRFTVTPASHRRPS